MQKITNFNTRVTEQRASASEIAAGTNNEKFITAQGLARVLPTVEFTSTTQLTNRNTAVTSSQMRGVIKSASTTLSANTAAYFEVTNSLVEAGDVVKVYPMLNSGELDFSVLDISYFVSVVAGKFTIVYRNNSASNISNEISFYYELIKSPIRDID